MFLIQKDKLLECSHLKLCFSPAGAMTVAPSMQCFTPGSRIIRDCSRWVGLAQEFLP